MMPQPTAIKLKLMSVPDATVSFSGPFACVRDALQSGACALSGCSRINYNRNTDDEVDIILEFDYGNFIYHDRHVLFGVQRGGVKATLFWIDADVTDWMVRELPGQISARRMIEQIS